MPFQDNVAIGLLQQAERGFAASTILRVLLDGFLRGLNGLRKKGLDLDEEHEKHTSGAKALGRFAGFMYGLKPVPFNASSSSAACKALGRFVAFSARLKPCPDTKQSELGLNKSQVSKKRPGAPSVFWIGLVFKGNRKDGTPVRCAQGLERL